MCITLSGILFFLIEILIELNSVYFVYIAYNVGKLADMFIHSYTVCYQIE